MLGGGVITARNSQLLSGITGQLIQAAPRAQVRIIDVPPVVGAALLGLDHVHAPAAAESRLRAAYERTPVAETTPDTLKGAPWTLGRPLKQRFGVWPNRGLAGYGRRAAAFRPNSPLRTPATNAYHSARVNRWTGP